MNYKLSLQTHALENHYGKQQAAYVTNANKQTVDTEYSNMKLEEIIDRTSGAIYSNAAQAWNHAFYWQCLTPKGGGQPTVAVLKALDTHFGSFSHFKEAFTKAANSGLSSGWIWLVKDLDENLVIQSKGNADTPIKDGCKAILACDVWGHESFIDSRNNRTAYIEGFWKLVNWKFVEENLKS